MARYVVRMVCVGFAISVICTPFVAFAADPPSDTVANETVVSDSPIAAVEKNPDQSVAAVDAALQDQAKPRPLFQHTSYPSAWKAAQQSNRPILVFVCMPNCHYCVKMKEQVYQLPHVRKLVANSFETIKADRFAHPKLISSLKIRLYPTTVLVGPNNKILDVIEGYADAGKFQRRLQTGIASATSHASATATR